MTHFLPRLSIFGFLAGLLFLEASLTPSLIPRGALLQGILGGVVAAIGYLLWRIVELIWQAADMPIVKGRLLWVLQLAAGVALLALLVFALRHNLLWQNDLRERMGMEPATGSHIAMILLIAAIVFATIHNNIYDQRMFSFTNFQELYGWQEA